MSGSSAEKKGGETLSQENCTATVLENGDIAINGDGIRAIITMVMKTMTEGTSLSNDPKERKGIPLCTGVLDYFPDALAEVAKVSLAGNKQHNTGDVLRWDRTKSTDEADSLMRHLVDRGRRDSDGVRHSAKVAWRALALLQKEIETERNVTL